MHLCALIYTHVTVQTWRSEQPPLSWRPQELNQSIKTGSYMPLPAELSGPHVVLKLVHLFLVILKTFCMGICPFAM